MPSRNFETKISGERVEFVALDLRHQTTGQINSAKVTVNQAIAGKHARYFAVKQRQIKTGVMRHQNRFADKLQPGLGDVRKFRSDRKHLSRNPGQGGNEARDGGFGIDQRLEGVEDFSIADAIGADLDNACGRLAVVNGFNVEDYKFSFPQRLQFAPVVRCPKMVRFEHEAWIVLNKVGNQRGSQMIVGV